jgi:adenosylmethionine-8-amino-7-oxononanoate aminotransferase
MSHIFHRNPKQTPLTAVRGEGLYIIDAAGQRYLDASGGAAVSCLGHAHPRITRAMQRQAEALEYAHTSFFTTQAAEDLATWLIERAPAGLARVYFLSGGSEAVEAALKLARQYFVEAGQPQRRHFIARQQSYHGNTLGALAIGGNAGRRAPFLPILTTAQHVSPCYAYRQQGPTESEEQYAQRLADELEAKILELGPDQVAAFVAETVVGATLGAVPPVRTYFQKIRAVCDKYGVLLILDEVMAGMGRTGLLFACAEDGVSPDLLVIAKGLGAGYQPIGAMLVSQRIYDTIVNGSGAFMHGHTYSGHAVACAAALEVQKVIAEERLLDNVLARGEQLRGCLREVFGQHPNVGDIRGRGLFVGLELVADRDSQAPLPPARRTHARVKAEAMRHGLLVYPSGGTVDGQAGDHVLLAPPFICTPGDIEQIVALLAPALNAALAV